MEIKYTAKFSRCRFRPTKCRYRIKAEEKALAEKQEAEQAKKSEIDDVVEKMLSDGVSADDILAKLK